MHNKENRVNPPMKIPVHAIGRPLSPRLRICFKETVPNINAMRPAMMLAGKQIKPVNGIGTIPAQNVSTVKIPKMRLRMDCVFVGE